MRVIRILSIVSLIALLAVIAGCERKVVNDAKADNDSLNGCFSCHGETSFNGALLQARGEWQNSIHASGNNVDYTNRDKSDCQACHDQQGFLDMLNTGAVDTLKYSIVSGIHCFTCHAPHENGNLQLRTETAYTLKNGVVFDHGAANLCVRCHHTRTALTADLGTGDSLTLSSRFGPHHGPQGDMLQGTHGYQYSNYTYTSTTHATTVNDACIGCHMGNPAQHDGYNIGGHSFNMRYESEGTEYTLIGVCAPCHSRFSETGVTQFDDFKPRDIDGDGTIEGVQTEFDNLSDSLGVLLSKVINSSTGLFRSTKVSKGQAGAAYNYAAYREDRSRGVHNPKYFEGLLKSSIAYMNANPIP